MVTATVSVDDVRAALHKVADPKIPAISVIDLGIIEDIALDGKSARISVLPTFVGCPALDVIREDIEEAVRAIGLEPDVSFVYSPPWSSDRITEDGHRKLREYGLAPPPSRVGDRVTLTLLSSGPCPYCGSRNTVMESPFGPTACRATCYCRACRNPFEQFKPV